MRTMIAYICEIVTNDFYSRKRKHFQCFKTVTETREGFLTNERNNQRECEPAERGFPRCFGGSST